LQHKYTGDIGDYVKYGLLRALCQGLTLGVAWYLYPDEHHKGDGRHIAYFSKPMRWRHLDPPLFDCLHRLVQGGRRSVSEIEASRLLKPACFSFAALEFTGRSLNERRAFRRRWFDGVLSDLREAEIVFADPDNGLCEDGTFSYGRRDAWKRLPMREARALSDGRPAIFYHHNSRFPGGHALEVQKWIGALGEGTLALRWRAYSPRTFFLVNPTPALAKRLEDFARRWRPYAELQT
jgi:hypothetical protein